MSVNIFGIEFDRNQLKNHMFSDWYQDTLLPIDWSVQSGNVFPSDVDYKYGPRALGMTSGYVYQDQTNFVSFAGKRVTFCAWMKASESGRGRLGLNDGISTAWSDYHSGDGEYQYMQVTLVVNVAATRLRVILQCAGADSSTVVVDEARLSGWTFDSPSAVNFDEQYTNIVVGEGLSQLVPASGYYVGMETHIDDIIYEMDEDSNYTKYLDLLSLIPEKFRNSEILQQFVSVAGGEAGTWLSSIDDILRLVDPNEVGSDYIDRLSALISVDLTTNPDATIEEKRDQLLNSIDWYKIKGTYEAVLVVSYMSGLAVNLYDFFTEDYITFVRSLWYVGELDENPPGIPLSYYKTPHFGIEIVLNRVHGSAPDEYLYHDDRRANLIPLVEEARPANTVPHYGALMMPWCKEDFQMVTTDAKIMTTITDHWQYTRWHFDQRYPVPVVDNLLNPVEDNQNNPVNAPNPSWTLDSGIFFDQQETAFLMAITRWKLGTGNKGVPPSESSFALQNVVLEGVITRHGVFADRTEFEILLDTSVIQPGISELGLFLYDEVTPVVFSTFPDVDKVAGMELRIIVQVLKS